MQNKNIKRGDKVKFLNDVGGGVVTRVEGKILYVEDEIGFDVPVPVHEVVLIETAEETSPKEVDALTGKQDEAPEGFDTPGVEDDSDDDLIDPAHDDNNPRFYLAFTHPGGISPEEQLPLYIVNDSNYYCFYLIIQMGEDGLGRVLFNGRILPNTKEQLGQMELIGLDVNWQVQLLLYRKDKPQRLFDPVNELVKIKAHRFFKDNSFAVNDFFHEKAVLLPILKDEFEKKVEALSASETRQILQEKGEFQVREPRKRVEKTPDVVEVDLHIHELLDDTRGLTNAELLKIQLDRVHAVMEEYANKQGQKIVFIHGIGNGTLKHEVRRLLNTRYKKHNFQDASFREYGFGATMVVI